MITQVRTYRANAYSNAWATQSGTAALSNRAQSLRDVYVSVLGQCEAAKERTERHYRLDGSTPFIGTALANGISLPINDNDNPDGKTNIRCWSRGMWHRKRLIT